jgi:uncharacterized protein (UPF0332 family)
MDEKQDKFDNEGQMWKELSIYRMSSAKETLEDATFNMLNQRYKTAANRAYYAIL